MQKSKLKKWATYGVLLILIPIAVFGGAFLFGSRGYAWISLCVTLLSCIPFFLHFEKHSGTKRLVLIAALTALSVLGRILFMPVPGFKPVAAMVIITAMYFGGEAGFMTGALSALISDFAFGLGPWTPFQMFAWGLIGLFAGLLADPLRRSRIALTVYALFAGAAFSLLMDVWTTLWADGYFNLSRYGAAIVAAVPFTVVYAVSNAVFLLLLAKPIGKVLDRLKTKYAL